MTSRSWKNFLTELPSNDDGNKNIVSFSEAMSKDLTSEERVVNDGLKVKSCDIHLYNKNGLLMPLESFCYARLEFEEREASTYSAM